jgi:hypothetical protein
LPEPAGEKLAVDELRALYRQSATSGITEDMLPALEPAGRPELDVVDCTVFAPPTVGAGDSALVQVFVHAPEYEDLVIARATEFDPQTGRRVAKSLGSHLQRGTHLTFDLHLPGLLVDDPIQILRWDGRPDSVQFGVSVPVDCPSRTVIGTC